jgi:hypothetical protein
MQLTIISYTYNRFDIYFDYSDTVDYQVLNKRGRNHH